MGQIVKMILWFVFGYFLMDKISRKPSTLREIVRFIKTDEEYDMSEAYMKKIRWHPLINFIIFFILGYYYISNQNNPTLKYVLIISGIWTGLCILLDLLRYSLTCRLLVTDCYTFFKDFYSKYTLWIFGGYVTLFFGVVLGGIACKQ